MDDTPPLNQPKPETDALEPVIKRPWSVTLLALGVLIITVINGLRFVLSIRYWTFLNSLSGISPLYLALTGLIWTVVGVVLVWGLWKAKTWTPRLMQVVGLTYALYYWLDQVFLKDHSVSGTSAAIQVVLPTNWPFAVAVTMISLAFMVWTLGRVKVKEYFGSTVPADNAYQVGQDDQ